jgi:hypothetical protein
VEDEGKVEELEAAVAQGGGGEGVVGGVEPLELVAREGGVLLEHEDVLALGVELLLLEDGRQVGLPHRRQVVGREQVVARRRELERALKPAVGLVALPQRLLEQSHDVLRRRQPHDRRLTGRQPPCHVSQVVHVMPRQQ